MKATAALLVILGLLCVAAGAIVVTRAAGETAGDEASAGGVAGWFGRFHRCLCLHVLGWTVLILGAVLSVVGVCLRRRRPRQQPPPAPMEGRAQ